MIANYYTLRHIAADLNARLHESRLIEAFSQNRSELVLLFQGDLDAADNSTAIIVSCEPASNFIVARDAYARARRNSVDFFSAIFGEHLTAVRISQGDREIAFDFSSRRTLLCQFFGSRANVLLCDEHRVVLEPFLKTVSVGYSLPAPPDSSDAGLTRTSRAFCEAIRSRPEDERIQAACKRRYPRFGSTILREAFHLSGIAADQAVRALSDRDLESLHVVCTQLEERLLGTPAARIYYQQESPVEFAIIALEHLAELRTEMFDDLHLAIRTFIGSAHRNRLAADERKAVERVLRRELEQTERTIEKLTTEAAAPAQADQLELYGKLLTAHLHTLSRGMREAIVENVYHETREPVIIPLDQHLTPAKNAERCFDRARKLRTAVEEQKLRRGELTANLHRLRGLFSELEEAGSAAELNAFIAHHAQTLAALGYRPALPGKAAPPPPPFRLFTVAGGFHVWAGKSGENNDLLTTRHTAKDDLWFHARGVGGSHVVLKVHSGKGEVSKAAIEQTASIAAFYSKMKNASMVPVTMCEGKYVRKPKGAPVGTVVVEREQTIFAEPRLPPSG